jgi:hypothetical protein
MIGAPRDFDELVQQFGSVIKSVGPCDVLLVAHHLWNRGVLRSYRAPRVVTREQMQDYVGVSSTLWSYALQQPKKCAIMPAPIEGKVHEPTSTYLFADVRAFYPRRSEVFPQLALRRGFKPACLPGYGSLVVSEAKKVLDEMGQGRMFDLPADLPQNNNDLHRSYKVIVAQVVRRRLKYGMEVEDAINEIWVRLFKADLLTKFIRSGPSRLPAHLTLDETLDFLGVDWSAWQRMMKEYADAPNPSKGSADSQTAVYRSEDILILDQGGYFRERGARVLPGYAVSREMLNKYVMRAAEQHLKNLFRTLGRRFNREDILQDRAYISENRAVRLRRCDATSNQAWEDSLRSEDPLADQVLELKQRLGVAGEVEEVFTALAG